MRNFISILVAILPLAAAVPAPYKKPCHGTHGCTAKSFGDFSWLIEGFTYHASYIFSTPAHQIASGTVVFNLTNPAIPEKVTCSGYSSQLTDFFYGNFNYDCVAPTGSTTKTSFAFSRPSGQLDINQTWTCTDQNPHYPVTFTGYGTVNLTLPCNQTYYQNPNWTMGAIYSDREIGCTAATLSLKPHDKTAVA